ncbi:hypothetical protein [Halofilum ochraceum]|uniref:hypothetical protein n=1 Tax=Halofilum ochraceum TaxID=1611323 RepID=UPI000834B4AE|nr:hypothetical protein [Halofilum ochraceum]
MPRLLFILALSVGLAGAAHAEQTRWIQTDRSWDRLPDTATSGPRATLAAAARALGDQPIQLAGIRVDRDLLDGLAATPAEEPLLRAAREAIGRPVDLTDFLYLLDDLAAAGGTGLHGQTVHLPSGRARAAGILLHPDDVFDGEPRRYGGRRLAIYQPRRPAELEPANDGDPLGPRWTARYRNPDDGDEMLEALSAAGGADFARRIRSLLEQFRAQGADAWVFSTVRSRERGYLIYGAFILSRASSEAIVNERIETLERLNREWDLDIPIRWRHPEGWRATVDAADAMANAYNVVYATRSGARYSSHYGASAADFAAMALPRELTLTAPDGSRRTFDLSDPDHPRDLNLSPELIGWVEEHFGMKKLRSDYPHWTDAVGD